MAKQLVCRDCHRIQETEETESCIACGSTSLTEDWAGYVVIGHPDQSVIAEEMGVTEPGKYALKVR